LNEHKRWFDEKRKENPDFFAAGKRNQYHILCPVCGETILEDEGAICPTCGWEMDIVQQSDPNYKGGANALSLNQKKEWFAKERAKDPEYNWEIKEIIRPGEEMSDQEFNEQLFVFFPEAIPAAERRRVFANGCNFQIDAKITCASYFAPFLIKSVEPHNEKDLKRCCRMIYWMLVKGKRGIEVFAASIAKPLAEKNIDPLSLPLLEQSRQTISSVRKKAK
jgi:uncharacterized Zn finger protein (UPF0148 family)